HGPDAHGPLLGVPAQRREERGDGCRSRPGAGRAPRTVLLRAAHADSAGGRDDADGHRRLLRPRPRVSGPWTLGRSTETPSPGTTTSWDAATCPPSQSTSSSASAGVLRLTTASATGPSTWCRAVVVTAPI